MVPVTRLELVTYWHIKPSTSPRRCNRRSSATYASDPCPWPRHNALKHGYRESQIAGVPFVPIQEGRNVKMTEQLSKQRFALVSIYIGNSCSITFITIFFVITAIPLEHYFLFFLCPLFLESETCDCHAWTEFFEPVLCAYHFFF